MSRFRDSSAPRAPRSGPVGGLVMIKLIRARGLIPGRFVGLRPNVWRCDVTDRVTGEAKGQRWVCRDGMKWTVLREEPQS